MNTHHFRNRCRSIAGLPYRIAYKCWRSLPEALHDRVHRTRTARAAKILVRDSLARFAGRDDIYSATYYEYVDAEAARSAPAMARSILTELAPSAVIDIGCGTGALLLEFRRLGVRGVGLEYSESALARCRKSGLDVRKFDIEAEQSGHAMQVDVVTCFEVGEHLEARFADRLVDLCLCAAPVVVFSAATPGQGGGVDHVNEQPNEYWIDKFRLRGAALDSQLTDRLRQDWAQAEVAGFYHSNVMVFQRLSLPDCRTGR